MQSFAQETVAVEPSTAATASTTIGLCTGHSWFAVDQTSICEMMKADEALAGAKVRKRSLHAEVVLNV